MRQTLLMMLGLLALLGVTACHAPGAAPTGVVFDRPAQATIRLGGYRLQALVEANELQHVDHLKLHLLKKNAQGAYVATGVTRSVAPSALAAPISLGHLKLGQAYRVQADAYADAAETRLISEAAASATDFTMPGLTTVGGVATVDETPFTLALRVRLSDKTYAGHATFPIALANGLKNRTDSLRVSLYQLGATGADLKLAKTFAWSVGGLSVPMANLKHGTAYRLVAEAFDGTKKLSVDANSTLNFTVPSPSAGAIDDDVNVLLGALTVPCDK